LFVGGRFLREKISSDISMRIKKTTNHTMVIASTNYYDIAQKKIFLQVGIGYFLNGYVIAIYMVIL